MKLFQANGFTEFGTTMTLNWKCIYIKSVMTRALAKSINLLTLTHQLQKALGNLGQMPASQSEYVIFQHFDGQGTQLH